MTTLKTIADARQRGAAFADLVRLHTARLPIVAFLIAGFGQPTRHLVGGSLLILSSYGLAATGNDLCDVEIDRANGRSRPLATGSLAASDAHAAMVVCAAFIAASQLLLPQPLGLTVSVAAVAAGVAYSHPVIGLERRGVWGTATLAVSYLVLPALLAGDTPALGLVAVLVAGGTATLLYKDVKDENGDRSLGKLTPLVRWGHRRMDLVAAVLGVGSLLGGSLVAGTGWWTVAQLGALGTQLAMATTGTRAGPLLWAHRLLATGGLVGLLAA